MNGITSTRCAIVCLLAALAARAAAADEPWRLIFPEQRHLEIRSPSQLPRCRLPETPVPRTVGDQQPAMPAENLGLDEAIRIALANTQAVRVLQGVGVVNSMRTIYDAAVTNTQIDQARAKFDPTFQAQNTFSRQNQPVALFIPGDPNPVIIGNQADRYDLNAGVSKNTVTGGTATLGIRSASSLSNTRFPGGSDLQFAPGFQSLNPQDNSSFEMGYTQPLLQGAGVRANLAPIVIARIDTERSFFQTKDSLQEMVRGVIEAYWGLVLARTELWARQHQVAQGETAFRRAEALLEVRMGNAADVAQARTAVANFRAALVTAQANVLSREATLRNILGLPPSSGTQFVPITPVAKDRLPTDWSEIVMLAEERRPDLIELKLVLEADHQRRILANNQALPRLDASALYRWNGLEGRTPSGTWVSTLPGQFPEWQLGVNFSVPLGLRDGRARVRQQDLIIHRDKANLEQGLQSTAHILAASYRALAQFYEQYRALGEAREAARINAERQMADFLAGRTIYLNVLQSITDWGNAVNAEAQALVQYNIELANLERQTGTILETHGVRFHEERFCSIGPLGRPFADRPYPMDTRPSENIPRYPQGSAPSEQGFELTKPASPDADEKRSPHPDLQPRDMDPAYSKPAVGASPGIGDLPAEANGARTKVLPSPSQPKP